MAETGWEALCRQIDSLNGCMTVACGLALPEPGAQNFSQLYHVCGRAILSCFPRRVRTKLGHQLLPTWGAGITGSGLPYSATVVVPERCFIPYWREDCDEEIWCFSYIGEKFLSSVLVCSVTEIFSLD